MIKKAYVKSETDDFPWFVHPIISSTEIVTKMDRFHHNLLPENERKKKICKLNDKKQPNIKSKITIS